MWSDCADKVLAKKEFPGWLSSYMSFMFDAADTSGISNFCSSLPYQPTNLSSLQSRSLHLVKLYTLFLLNNRKLLILFYTK